MNVKMMLTMIIAVLNINSSLEHKVPNNHGLDHEIVDIEDELESNHELDIKRDLNDDDNALLVKQEDP